MALQKYSYFLNTGSGRKSIDLTLDDDTTYIEINVNWMGAGRHVYHLKGQHLPITPNYGWLNIERAEHREPDSGGNWQSEDLHVEALGGRAILEYFKIERAPFPEHPDDLGALNDFGWANWNEEFDLLVIVQETTERLIYSLEHYGDFMAEEEEPLTEEQIEHFVKALLTPDKMKFKLETE